MKELSDNFPLKKFQSVILEVLKFPIIFIVTFFIIVSRRADAVLNPQFWAEDGRIWYSTAYNDGAVNSIFFNHSGYYQTISGLVASGSLLLPFSNAPLFFNLVAIICKIIVVYFLLSSRMRTIAPLPAIRILLAFIYLALPNSYEVNANLTNVQWHLALLSFLILISQPSQKIIAKIFDGAVLFISALSGPFCLFLFPIGLFYWWKKRETGMLYLLFILLIGCFVQGWSVLTHERITSVPLGADLNLFSEIIGGQVFFSGIFGVNYFARISQTNFWNFIAPIITFAGLIWLIYSFVKVSVELKLFIIFSAMICAGALVSPAASETEPQWQVLSQPFVGSRYWFIPVFCILSILLYQSVNSENSFIKKSAIVLLLLAPVGMIKDWKYTPFQDYNFQHYAAEFESVSAGTNYTIPINPDWDMKLIKH